MLDSSGFNGVDREILSDSIFVTYLERSFKDNYCGAVLVGSQAFKKISKASNVQLR